MFNHVDPFPPLQDRPVLEQESQKDTSSEDEDIVCNQIQMLDLKQMDSILPDIDKDILESPHE